MNEEYAFDPVFDAMLAGIQHQMQKLKEESHLQLIDNDGSLAETDRMLKLKRGCRRK